MLIKMCVGTQFQLTWPEVFLDTIIGLLLSGANIQYSLQQIKHNEWRDTFSAMLIVCANRKRDLLALVSSSTSTQSTLPTDKRWLWLCCLLLWGSCGPLGLLGKINGSFQGWWSPGNWCAEARRPDAAAAAAILSVGSSRLCIQLKKQVRTVGQIDRRTDTHILIHTELQTLTHIHRHTDMHVDTQTHKHWSYRYTYSDDQAQLLRRRYTDTDTNSDIHIKIDINSDRQRQIYTDRY